MTKTKYIANVSFGKDSLAMLLRLIEEKKPLDEVVFFDTGVEFKAIYNIRDKIKPILASVGVEYTELKPSNEFLYSMLEKPVKKRNGKIENGYSWCGGLCRWGTTEKIRALEKNANGAIIYLGIAFDEKLRLQKQRQGVKLFPLADWKMTESDCLKYCYDAGYSWNEDGVNLYDILDRVSCWCCKNKNLKELRNYYKHLPNYWEKLKELQSKTQRPFKTGKTVFELEEKFKLEEMQKHLF
jgi:3'-phosphoadenosine 5'-phosphosulfate sulfotransferase (PAPS reductase)/FAD synthetase